MSFGSGGGFGSNTGGFGGFGSTNTNSGFGATNNTSTGGSLFGGNTSTAGGFGTSNTANTSGGFGGFGANKPATTGFGAPASAAPTNSLFGGSTATSGGGFGSGGAFGASNTASTGFGGGNTTGGGLFGQNKPAAGGFGSTNTGGNSLFGGSGTTGGFGANNSTAPSNPFGGGASTTTGFGATNTNTGTGFGGGGSFGASATASNNNGTAGTQFQPFTEKDTASNQTSTYQSITMMQPYQQKSFEELRVEDYLQGRRFGNQNGQAGSFGQSTGFGGNTFGNNNATATSTGGGLFGNNTATSGSTGGGFGFGTNNNAAPASTGFGASNTNTGGGLFGATQNKPAGTSLFGNTATSGTTSGGFGSTTGNTGGGLFGGGGGFGANNNQQQSGGLFGATNNQQNKPAFGGFGTTNNTTTSAFGGTASSTTGGGIFGSNNNSTSNAGGSLFGASQNNQPTSNPFGTSTNTGGTSLFGGAQNKPAGSLFGGNTNTTNTTGGLFGSTNNNQQQQSTPFGGSTGGGGLFGNANNQAKPASGGLFGSTTNTGNTGGGLFGSGNNQQQQSGGSLFGGNNAGSSLFGGNQNKPTGNSLFGGNNNTSNVGGGLFGGGLGQNNQQTQQSGSSSLFGNLGGSTQSQQQNSLFGPSMSQNQTPQQNQLHASLTMSPYGNDQLFTSLGQASAPVGPLATPLNGARAAQNKTPSLLSSTRLNSPIYTPRASTFGRNGSYGLSYSTYGSPGSAYSVSLTPQQSSLLKPSGSLGSALTSRLAKSMSMNNLRGGDGTPREGESLLRPTPGSASQKYLQSGNMRKLTIDRSLRQDLFAPPEQRQIESSRRESDGPGLKGKNVSFDNSANSANAAPSSSNALVRTEETQENENSENLFRGAPRSQPQPQQNGTPEMQQVNGNAALSTVMEDGEHHQRPTSAPATQKPAEKSREKSIDPGEYWSKPSIKELHNMSRASRKLSKFVVGRENVGFIEFSACDLADVNPDEIFGGICDFRTRKVTVYPDNKKKPSQGKGLNVPSTIHLEQSWPRSGSGRNVKSEAVVQRHIKRLQGTKGTEFVGYDTDTGIWTFKVQHFTTYGFDDDSDEFTEDTEMDHDDGQQESSDLSEPPGDDTMQSVETGTGELDDTFDFQKNKKQSQSSWLGQSIPGGFGESQLGRLPGGFADSEDFSHNHDDQSADEGANEDHLMSGGSGENDAIKSAGGAVQPPSPGAYERHNSSMALDDTTGAVDIAEEAQGETSLELPGTFVPEEPKYPRSILKPSTVRANFASPEKLATESWEEQLQRTMSPKKRDRLALRDLQRSALHDGPAENTLKQSIFGRSTLGQSALGQSYLAQKSAKKIGFGASTFAAESNDLGRSQTLTSHMDLMNSLWEQQKPNKKGLGSSKGFENPYPKRPRLSAPNALSDKLEFGCHDSMQPFFSNNSTIAYSISGSSPNVTQPLQPALRPLVDEHREIRFAKWSEPKDINPVWFAIHKNSTSIQHGGAFAVAKTSKSIPFRQLVGENASQHEKAIWTLAHILFDALDTFPQELLSGMTEEQMMQYGDRLRKKLFADFWSDHLAATAQQQLGRAQTAEERALLHLTTNNIGRACDVLVAGKDFKLATMVAQLPGTQRSRELMQAQIEVWRQRNDWSEMSESVRALYSIIAGEVCTVNGKAGPAEDRVSSFCIAERYGLNWMQSFGLRVFFGGHSSIADATEAYVADLMSSRERVAPLPSWEHDDVPDGREDVLLGLLRLSIANNDSIELFDAKTVSGSAVNSRVAWQLAMLFDAKGMIIDPAAQKIDQLTLNFATELEAADHFVTAVWVLLHLRDTNARAKAITAIIHRNAAKLIVADEQHESDKANAFALLIDDLQIPPSIVWSAEAQYARAVLGDAILQATYLLYAGLADEAHDVLCTTIGPTAVIEEDFDGVRRVLELFRDHRIEGWERNGQVFEDFVLLDEMSIKTKRSKQGREIMERLSIGLEAMRDDEAGMRLEQRVAIVEMMRVLAEDIRDFEASTGQRVRIKRDEMEVDRMGDGFSAFERYQQALGVVA